MSQEAGSGEFDFIARYLRPLAAGTDAALGLADDAAVLTPQPGRQLVVTSDTLNEGVHFLPDDPPETLGHKCLAVNLSDLASMGATPVAYTLNLALPESCRTVAWFDAFTKGLSDLQSRFGLHLIGGDTTSTLGPLSLTVTAFGEVKPDHVLKRSGARAGDLVMVTGTIGGGYMGLKTLMGELEGGQEAITRYRTPEPRCDFVQEAAPLIHAAMDVSDGLLADAGHMAKASGVRFVLQMEHVPFPESAQPFLEINSIFGETLVTGGDDYEILFTTAPSNRDALVQIAAEQGLLLSCIGEVSEGQGVEILDAAGTPISIARAGFKHF